MQVFGPSFVHGAQGISGPHAPRTAGPAETTTPAKPVGDQVEISAAAEAAIQATETEGVRHDLVARIRSEIATGTYETPDKIEQALDRFLDELG